MTRYADISTERTAGFLGGQVTQAALDDDSRITEPVTVLSTRDYCGGHVYADGRLERTLQPWGYTDAEGADYFYIIDYLGNVRTVTDKHGYACELNAYYPYGALMNTLSGNGTVQPYKYGGKELDRTAGLDLYDSQARFYDPVLGRTTTVDPKSAAYAGTSHYGWCAGNPTRYVDPDGRDICVLIIPGHFGQMAMLIQGEDSKWMYYSINGDNIGFGKGRPFDDIEPVDPKTGEPRKWDSPQEFLDSEYNSDGDRKDKENTNHFNYQEGYVIKSTPEQDKTMRKEFRRISENEDYNLLSNNCAQTVQRSMIAGGLRVATDVMESVYSANPLAIGGDGYITGKMQYNLCRRPSDAYKQIKMSNPGGFSIYKRNQ